MPNWCQNTAVIHGPKPVIDEIKGILASEEVNLLNWMRPMPFDEEGNWYDWCVTNWGTKWDVREAFVSDDTEEDSITFSFDSAWAPPVAAFRSWAQRDGRVTYRLTYIETGMGFVGWDAYDGEYFDEDYAEQNQDADSYWEMAEQEFGYIREEEEYEESDQESDGK